MIRLLLSLVCVAAFSTFGAFSLNEEGKNYFDEEARKQLWKQIAQSDSQSLPKTGMQHAQKIFDSAMQDQDYPEAVRALMKKLRLEAQINQPSAPFLIRKLSAEIDNYPDEIKPVMKTILANWFFTYYQQNRWRFAQRSQTAQVPSEDFETWDLTRLLNHIDSLFRSALENSDQLKHCLLYTSPSPRDATLSRMPSSA